MNTYRLKAPVEAVQWSPGVEHPAVQIIDPPLMASGVVGEPESVEYHRIPPYAAIDGGEGSSQVVNPGDWIVCLGGAYVVLADGQFRAAFAEAR